MAGAKTNTKRRVTKKEQAFKIFDAKLKMRAAGKFDSNKAFRRACLDEMVKKIGVSIPSAATMYNQAKQAAEADNPSLGLGRDPKKVVVKKPKAKAKAKAKPAAQPAEAETPAESNEEATA
jgi:hypothetical protein